MRTWRIHAAWAIVTLITAAVWGNLTANRAKQTATPAPLIVSPPRSVAEPKDPDRPIRPERAPEKPESRPAAAAGPLGPEEIRRLFQSGDPESRRQAYMAFQKLTDRNVKLDLLKSVSTVDDDYTIHRVIMELGLLGGPEAGEVLVQIMKSDRKAWMKEQAAGWLGNTGGPGALECLLEAYHTNAFYLQVASAGSLYKLGYPGPLAEMLPKVGAMLENADGSIRSDAAEQLGHLASPEALPLLTRALQDSNGDVRIQAIRALGTRKIPGAISLVEKMLGDPNPDVAYEAQRTLKELRNPSETDPK